jgi:hypothetical protein
LRFETPRDPVEEGKRKSCWWLQSPWSTTILVMLALRRIYCRDKSAVILIYNQADVRLADNYLGALSQSLESQGSVEARSRTDCNK